MVDLIASVCVIYAILFAIGIPILLCASRYQSSISAHLSIGLSPAITLALVTIFSFPAYRLFGAVSSWNLNPIYLIGFCPIYIYFILKNIKKTYLLEIFKLQILQFFLGLLLLAGFLFHGIGKSLWIYNPSDAFVYLTLADSVINASWSVLFGASGDPASAGAAELLRQSSTGLYSARFVSSMPMRMATMIDLGIFSYISKVNVYQSIYAFYALLSLVISSTIFSLSRVSGSNFLMASIAAFTSIFCYWGFLIHWSDSYSQLQAIPLIILFAYGFGYFLESKDFYGGSFLVILPIAALVCAYTEFTTVFIPFIFILILYFRLYKNRDGIKFSATIFLAPILLLVITDQFLYYLRNIMRQFNLVTKAATPIGSTQFDALIDSNPIGSLVGSWWSLGYISPYAYLIMTAGSIAAIYFVVRSLAQGNVFYKISTLGFLFSLVTAYSFLYIKSDKYSFFKIHSTYYSFLLIAASWVTYKLFESKSYKKLIIFLVFWTQLMYGPLQILKMGYEAYGNEWKSGYRGIYNFVKIKEMLDKYGVKDLLVDIPPVGEWQDSASLMLAINDLRPYYISGYLIDNNLSRIFNENIKPPEDPKFLLTDSSRKNEYAGCCSLLDHVGTIQLYKIISLKYPNED